MAMNRITLSLFSLAAFALPACEPLFVDFDGYREYPPDSGSGGSGNGGSGNGGSGNGGSANGASGGDAGSAAGGSGDPGGNGGAAAGGSGGDAGSGNGGSGNAAGNGGGTNGGDAGSGGSGASCSQSVSDVACNACLQANCCSQLEACPPGSDCYKYWQCVADNCWDSTDLNSCRSACSALAAAADVWIRLFQCACNDGNFQCRTQCQRTIGCGQL